MGMLKSITLENYKSYRDETQIEIKPLTVLCGVNSSGKSAILKSLLMMKQSVEKDTPYNKLSFMGNYVDNGYFDDIVNFNCNGEDDATFTIKNTFVIKRFEENQKKRQDMSSFKELRRLYQRTSNIGSFEISHSVTISRPIYDDKNNLSHYIKNNDVIEIGISIMPKDVLGEIIKNATGYIFIRRIPTTERTYNVTFFNIPVFGKLPDKYLIENNYPCQCYFNNIKLTNIYMNDMPNYMIKAKSTILSLFNIVSMQYSGVEFIAPLRQQPMRNYTICGDVDSVGIAGEDAPILYAKLYNDGKYTTDIVNPSTENTDIYNNDGDMQFTCNGVQYDFKFAVQKWMDYFDLGAINITGENGLLELKINNHNISDVGFGVSQVFPIIVQGLYMTKDEVLLLEQPEIHLHPQMQMRMADFLLSVAMSERNVIVETHSDHIINRITRRIMEDKDGSITDKVAVYFLENTQDGTKISQIKFDKIKGVIEAPVAFFGQYAAEIDDIMRVGYENLRNRGKQE